MLTDEQREYLRSLVKKHQLKSIGALLEERSQSAIQMVISTPDDYTSIGVTRIGGVPDLPPNLEWHTTDQGYMPFVAQINLSELPIVIENPLPTTGMLYFFVRDADLDPSFDVRHKIIYYDGQPNLLARAKQPDAALFGEDLNRISYKPHRIKMRVVISTPSWDSSEWAILTAACTDPDNEIGTWQHRYFSLRHELRGFDAPEQEISQILGYPAVNAEAIYHAQLVREGKKILSQAAAPNVDEVRKWILLLELGSHDDADMCWWDGGFLQFFIHENELKAKDFTRTYAAIDSA